MDTPQGHPALESVMLLIVADFMPNSAIFRALGLSSAPPQARRWGWIGGEMAELLMKSAICRLLVVTSPRVAEGLCYHDNLTVTQVIKNRRL